MGLSELTNEQKYVKLTMKNTIKENDQALQNQTDVKNSYWKDKFIKYVKN